jgi:hypothetical protein
MMQIKIEDNKVLVAQKNQEDLTGYQEASPVEVQIIHEANETDALAMINGAYYEPKNNADWQKERASRIKNQENMNIRQQIEALEKEVGPRAQREFALQMGYVGVIIADRYPNGKILDIDNTIKALLAKIQ